jgi:hypothetical protein
VGRSLPKPRRCVRVELRIRLVLVVGRLVVGNSEAKDLRRAARAGHGGHRPALKGTTDFLSLSLSLRLNGGRPFSDQGLRLEDTPSRGKLLKDSLDFSIIEPAVLSVV